MSLAGRRKAPLDAMAAEIAEGHGDRCRHHQGSRLRRDGRRPRRPRTARSTSSSPMPARPRARRSRKIDLKAWQQAIDVNLTGAFLTVSAALADVTRAPRRPHRLHRLDRGAQRLPLCRRLRRRQAWRRRPDEGAEHRAGVARASPSMPCVRASPTRRCSTPPPTRSPPRPAAAPTTRARRWRRTMPMAA